MITARIDGTLVIEALKKLGGIEAARAVTRALNRAATTVKNEVGKEVVSEVNLALRDAKMAIRVKRASPAHLNSDLIISGERVGLIKFKGTRPTKRGVSVKVLKAGPRKVIPGTFIASMRSGHRGVFWRRIGSKHTGTLRGSIKHAPTTYRPELKIDEKFSIGVQQALTRTRSRIDHLLTIGRDRITTELRREIQYRLTKRGPPAS